MEGEKQPIVEHYEKIDITVMDWEKFHREWDRLVEMRSFYEEVKKYRTYESVLGPEKVVKPEVDFNLTIDARREEVNAARTKIQQAIDSTWNAMSYRERARFMAPGFLRKWI